MTRMFPVQDLAVTEIVSDIWNIILLQSAAKLSYIKSFAFNITLSNPRSHYRLHHLRERFFRVTPAGRSSRAKRMAFFIKMFDIGLVRT